MRRHRGTENRLNKRTSIMRIDLIAAWQDGLKPVILQATQDKEEPVIAQSSFQFDASPKVVFVGDSRTQSPAQYYRDLSPVALTSEEQMVYDEVFFRLSENPKFYNGKHILLTGVMYDTTENTLYLEAVRVDYVFVAALGKIKQINSTGSALQGKTFFKTGVLVPFISSDDKVTLIARADRLKLNSVAAGFLECDDDETLLSSLLRTTVLKEADEEFAVDGNTGGRRLHFTGGGIASISFRESRDAGAMTPTMEFVVPLQAKEFGTDILGLMNANTASHAYEHIPYSAWSVPLYRNERLAASQLIKQARPGSFLYAPVVHACAQRVNHGMPLANQMSGVQSSRFYPIGIFNPAPRKALTEPRVEESVSSPLLTKGASI